MTVETLNSRNTFEGNGTTTQFSCTFVAIENDDITVFIEGGLLVEGVDYNIIGDVQSPPWIVEFTTAPLIDQTILVQRATDINQETIYQTFGRYQAKQHESDFDKGILIDQEIAQGFEDALRLVPGTDPPLWDARDFRMVRLLDPIIPNDAATKGYVDQVAGGGVDPNDPTVFATLTVLGEQVDQHLQDWIEPLQGGGINSRGLGLLQIGGAGANNFLEQIVFAPIDNSVVVPDNVFGYDFAEDRWETRGNWHFADGMVLENDKALRGDDTSAPFEVELALAKINLNNEAVFGDPAAVMVLRADGAFADIFAENEFGGRGTVWHQLNLSNPTSADEDETISGNWTFTNPVNIFVQNESGLYVGTGVDGTSAAVEWRGEEFWKFQADTLGSFTLYAQGPLGVEGDTSPAFAVGRDLGIRIFNTLAMGDGDIVMETNDEYIRMTDAALGNPTRVFGIDTDNILHIGAADFPIEAVEIGNSTGEMMRLTDTLVTVGIPNTKPIDLALANTAALQAADSGNILRDVVTITSGDVAILGSANLLSTRVDGQFVQINTFGQAAAIFDQNGQLELLRDAVLVQNNLAYRGRDIGATPRDLIKLDLTDTVVIGDTDIAAGRIELFSTDVINRFDGVINWQMWDTEALPNPVDGANLIISSDVEMIEIIDPELATNTTLEIHNDVALGIPKLTAAGLIRADQLPISALIFLGVWSPITDGSTPPADVDSSVGEFYVFNEAGDMTLFEIDDQTAHTVPVVAGDVMLFDDGVSSGNAQGWYHLDRNFPTSIPADAVTYSTAFSDWTNTNVQLVLDEISDRATLEDRTQTITEAWRWTNAGFFSGSSSGFQEVLQLGQIAADPDTPLVRIFTNDAVNRLQFRHTSESAGTVFVRADGSFAYAEIGGTPTASFFDLAHPLVPGGGFFAYRMIYDTDEMKLLVGDPLGINPALNDFLVWDGVTMVIADVNFPTEINSTFTRIIHGGSNTLFDSSTDIFPARNLVFSNNDSINWLDNVAAQQSLLVFNAANQFGVGNIGFPTILQGSTLTLVASTATWNFGTNGLLTTPGSIQIPNADSYNTLTLGAVVRNLLFMDASDQIFLGTLTEDLTMRAAVQAQILVGSENYTFSNGGTATFNDILILQDSGALAIELQMNNSVRNWTAFNDTDGSYQIRDVTGAQSKLRIFPTDPTFVDLVANSLQVRNLATLNGNVFLRVENDLSSWDLLNQGTASNRFSLTDNLGNIPFRAAHGMASFLNLADGIMQWNNPQLGAAPSFRLSQGEGQTWLFQSTTGGNLQIWELGGGVPLQLNFGHFSTLTVLDGIASFSPGYFNPIGSTIALRHGGEWELGRNTVGFSTGLYLFNNIGGFYNIKVDEATNHMLFNHGGGFIGIGHTDVPTALVDIRGLSTTAPRIRFGVTGVGTDALLLGMLSGNDGFMQINTAAGLVDATFRGDAGASFVNGSSVAFFGVGTASPTQALHVLGLVRVENATAPSLGAITNEYRFDVTGVQIRALNDVNGFADFGVGILTATGLNVTGASTLAGLTVNGATQLNGTLGVTGISTLAATQINSTLGVVGVSTLAATNISTTLGVGGLTTLTGLTNNGAAQINGTLGVTGLSTLAGINVTAGATLVALSTYKGVEIATLADIPPPSGGTTVTRFESAPIPWAQAGQINHGLGRVPDGFKVQLRCAVANNGWAVGDEIDITNLRINNDGSKGGWVSNLTIGWATQTINVNSFTPKAGASGSFTNAHWGVILRAWIYTD